MAISYEISMCASLVFLLFFSAPYGSCSGFSGSDRGVPIGGSKSNRGLLGMQRRRENPMPDCKEIVSVPQCSHDPNCRWCRSDALDDTCFSKAEAWRLPHQVFSCD